MTARNEVPGAEGTRFSSIRHVTETGSTNADLLAIASADPTAADIVLVTDHQSAGRGRQSRRWVDEPGNSALMSVLVRPGSAVAPVMPIVAGLALTDAVNGLLAREDPPPVALKWPNDVIAPAGGDRKLAGILAEATWRGAEPAVVVGMGTNLRWTAAPPAEVAERAITFEALGGTDDRWTVVRAVLVGLDRWLTMASDDGVGAVIAEFRLRCRTLGRAVRFETADGLVEGTATGVDEGGGLIVATAAGPVTLTAGDAHHV